MPSNTDSEHGAAMVTGGTPTGEGAYEHRDINDRAVITFLVSLFAILVVVAVLMWLWFRYLSIEVRAPASASPFANVRQVPPSPQLQVYPGADLRKTVAQQQEELETYSWEDRQAGTVRLPIERAMDLLLQKGLPVIPATADAGQSPSGNADSGSSGKDSNGGNTSGVQSRGNRSPGRSGGFSSGGKTGGDAGAQKH